MNKICYKKILKYYYLNIHISLLYLIFHVLKFLQPIELTYRDE